MDLDDKIIFGFTMQMKKVEQNFQAKCQESKKKEESLESLLCKIG